MKTIQFSIIALLSSVGSTSAFTAVTSPSRVSVGLRRTVGGEGALLSSTAEEVAPNKTDANNQANYGKDLELPDTYVRCGRCATSFAIKAEDLGNGKGRRVECSVCTHSWFQSRDRLFTLNEGRELVPLPQVELDRIASNIANSRDPDYIGDTKFFVGNLDFGVEEADIREIFAEKGEVGDVSLVTGPDGRSRGFAFVTMMDEKVLEECLKLDGIDLKGRNINIKLPN
jgi:predicted Zn finger-like uncharacterized protein